MKLKESLKKYNHALVFLYVLIYMPWFLYLENHVTTHYYVIQSPLDSLIPFAEIFVIPYLSWFAFMAVGAMFLFFNDRQEFLRMAFFLIIGMTTFLVICTVFPNGLHLRPLYFTRDNVFIDLVKKVYAADTATNVLPSLHVFNSLGICIGLLRNRLVQQHPVVRNTVVTITALIILSTMFLKQHSVTDVVAAFAMAGICYQLIYAGETVMQKKVLRQPVTWP